MSIDKQLNGYWDGIYFMVPVDNGYVRCAAIKQGDIEELTPFGRELLAKASENAVLLEEPKKRGRKVRTDEISIDGLDI